MDRLKLNPYVSFRKKRGRYVFYLNFDYFFFKEEAAELITALLKEINQERTTDHAPIPMDFVRYLIEKGIVVEV